MFVVFLSNIDLLRFHFMDLCLFLQEQRGKVCLGVKLSSEVPMKIQFSDTYAVEFINQGMLHGSSIQEVKKFFKVLKPNDSEVLFFIFLVYATFVCE